MKQSLVWQNKSLRERCISFLYSKDSIPSIPFMFLLLFNSPDLLGNLAGKDPGLKHGVSEGNTLGTRLGPLVGHDPGNEVAIMFVFVKWKHHMNSFWRHILIHVLLANCVACKLCL
jgi:hypothetical protein